ncbi:MAG: kynureninase, partial [Hyphococcus sp.]
MTAAGIPHKPLDGKPAKIMEKTPLAASLADAEALDRQDPLRTARDCFELDDALLYLDGNSLGAPPKKALARLHQAAHVEWKQGLIRSWNDAGWFDLPQTCGRKIAALIGVEENAVIVCDSVSVNIFKLASALIAGRKGALAWCAGEFPTDGYILQGLSRLTGAPLTKLADDDPAALTGDIAVLVKSAVHYKTAAVADIAAWEEAAKKHGLAIVWDLSHAAGVIDLTLARDGAQYAVGCGYKFLNGGPGAPAY